MQYVNALIWRSFLPFHEKNRANCHAVHFGKKYFEVYEIKCHFSNFNHYTKINIEGLPILSHDFCYLRVNIFVCYLKIMITIEYGCSFCANFRPFLIQRSNVRPFLIQNLEVNYKLFKPTFRLQVLYSVFILGLFIYSLFIYLLKFISCWRILYYNKFSYTDIKLTMLI